MIVNQQTLTETYVGFKTTFNKAFALAQPEYADFASIAPSTGRAEEYKWPGALPAMREWLGDAEFEKLEAYSWTIENKKWQAGLVVQREDLEDDRLGIWTPFIQEMGTEARRHPGELVMNLINDGFTKKAYDNQFYFDTDHKDGTGPVQSNKITAALTAASYQTARQMMRRIKDQKGRPLNLRGTTLLVPPELESTALTILEAETNASGATNVYAGTARLIVSPYLTSPTAWFLFDLSRGLKPFVLQTRRAPEFVAQDNPNDEHAFMREVYRYKVSARYNAGYGLWQLAVGSTGTT